MKIKTYIRYRVKDLEADLKEVLEAVEVHKEEKRSSGILTMTHDDTVKVDKWMRKILGFKMAIVELKKALECK